MHLHSRWIGGIYALLTVIFCLPSLAAAEPVRAQENAAAEQAAAAATVPEGFKMELFAAEPMLGHPVALDVDEQGRVFVVETYRVNQGVSDNRSSAFWIDDDLAAETVADRLAYQNAWIERGQRSEAWYTDHSEKLRLVIDEDGDGRADVSHLFADGFNHPLHGVASGVLALDGDIYFTNIPDLYRLRDTDGDHEADETDILHHGYGVRMAFVGHDLHGLTLGPDGKIYFTVGDRGYNIEQPDGSRLRDPMDVGRGALFRCNRDGSELEVVYYGLRNPQDLAFDQYGNLFTGDNNADGRDRARIVYLLEGGDSGWSMTFQYMQDRGPWERERIWELANEDQPAWTLPPLYHLSAGPSGFEYNPGLGLPAEYDEHFFLADFRGGPSNSGLHTFKLDQKGAGFEMVNPRQFVWNMLATDMKFGYDGKLYIADWEAGWGMKNPPTGRLHTLAHSEHVNDAAEAQVAELIREDFAAMPADELGDLLNHRDMRIRMRAQFALADQTQSDSDAAVLRTIAADASNDFVPARLHAVWGMGQVLRTGRTFVLDDLLERLDDENYHVRAQAAKVVGDAAASAAGGEAVRSALAQNDRIAPLIANLSDEAPHVQALTAIAIGKIGDEAAFEPLLRLLHANDDADPYLRHGAIMGIFGTSDADALVDRAATASSAQRLGIVLALRRHQDARLTQFLDDVEPHIVREAATAIYDMNVTDAMPALASLLNRYTRQATQAKEEPTFELAYYRNIEGNTIASLREATKFPAEPDDVDETVSLATPANTADNYGTRITGFIEPTQSGEHVFLVTADDSAEVYLSTSESPDDKRLIASAPEWAEIDNFEKHPEQTSEPIELVSGERYYIEVLHKEGNGGEHLIVGWRKPDGTQEVPIGGSEETAPVELLRRVINANLAVGTQEAAARVAHFAADVTQPTVLRAEALEVLAVWSQPPLRERVLNYTRPLEERDDQLVREALEPLIVTLVDNTRGQLQSQATDLATALDLALDEETLMARLGDAEQSVQARLAVLRSLIGSNSPRAREAIGKALEADEPLLRAEARSLLSQRDPAAGLGALREALADGTVVEQQYALMALGTLEHDSADAILAQWLDELLAGNVRRPLQLEVVEAAEQRRSDAVAERLADYQASLSAADPLAAYQIARRGGDAEAGQNVFFSHPAAQCIRCHTINGTGGDAGPDLTGIGARRTRAQLLADIITPNQEVAEGFGTVVLTLEDGGVVAGVLREETEEELTMVAADGQLQVVPLDEIITRTPAISAMPPQGAILTPRQLRDVIEYLATQD